MSKLHCWISLWVLGAVVACATTQPSGSESAGDRDESEALSFEEACVEETSLLALCGGDQCGLYPCREVMEHFTAGRIVPARGVALPLPSAQGGAQRNWGSAQDLPQDTRPVFIIPWDHKPLLTPSQQQMLEDVAKGRTKPYERHHIFPRAFRQWFAERGINIDEYVIPLELEKHRSIHRGERGGPWNEAWRKFIQSHQEEPTKEEIFRYAGQLIYEFELFGPVVPYWKRPPPLPPGY